MSRSLCGKQHTMFAIDLQSAYLACEWIHMSLSPLLCSECSVAYNAIVLLLTSQHKYDQGRVRFSGMILRHSYHVNMMLCICGSTLTCYHLFRSYNNALISYVSGGVACERSIDCRQRVGGSDYFILVELYKIFPEYSNIHCERL